MQLLYKNNRRTYNYLKNIEMCSENPKFPIGFWKSGFHTSFFVFNRFLNINIPKESASK